MLNARAAERRAPVSPGDLRIWAESDAMAHSGRQSSKGTAPAEFCERSEDFARNPTLHRGGDAARSATTGGQSRHILVVDDDLALRCLLRDLLESRRYTVTMVESGDMAIQACLGSRFDLILMDVQMPRMDGLSAAKGIRTNCPLNYSTPIMAVTGYISLDRVAELHAAGIDDYLPKPIRFITFFARVAYWCS